MKEEARAWLWTTLLCIGIITITVLALIDGAPTVLTVIAGAASLVCFGGYLSLKLISERLPSPREDDSTVESPSLRPENDGPQKPAAGHPPERERPEG